MVIWKYLLGYCHVTDEVVPNEERNYFSKNARVQRIRTRHNLTRYSYESLTNHPHHLNHCYALTVVPGNGNFYINNTSNKNGKIFGM